MNDNIVRVICNNFVLAALLTACGGGGQSGGNQGNLPAPVYYSVGGAISGLLTGNTVSIANNAVNLTTLNANGSFNFSNKLSGGSTLGVSSS